MNNKKQNLLSIDLLSMVKFLFINLQAYIRFNPYLVRNNSVYTFNFKTRSDKL